MEYRVTFKEAKGMEITWAAWGWAFGMGMFVKRDNETYYKILCKPKPTRKDHNDVRSRAIRAKGRDLDGFVYSPVEEAKEQAKIEAKKRAQRF